MPVAGPMDVFSHRLANRLVGNDEQAAALEITLVGPELRATGELVCAVTGAVFEVLVGDGRVECGQAFRVERGAHAAVRPPAGRRARDAGVPRRDRRPSGARQPCDEPHQHAWDRSADARSPPAISCRSAARQRRFPRRPRVQPLRLPEGGARLRAIPGPHETRFASVALDGCSRCPLPSPPSRIAWDTGSRVRRCRTAKGRTSSRTRRRSVRCRCRDPASRFC